MITLTTEITKDQYCLLIGYILKICDSFACSLPNFDKIFTNMDLLQGVEDISPFMKDSFFRYLDDGVAFEAYKTKVSSRLKLIADHQIKSYKSLRFATNLYDREREIYVYRIDSDLNFDFFETEGLFTWRYPGLPEDLCFYRNNKIYMEVIAHEELCFIEADEANCEFLDELGLEYWIE